MRIKYLAAGMALVIATIMLRWGATVSAARCPELRIIFARGSGAVQNENADYAAFKEALGSKMATIDVSYEIIDLEYPAAAVGIGSSEALSTAVGAIMGGGESYEFGRSVKKGVANLRKYARDSACPNTKYVLGGYSQGAMVAVNALPSFAPEKVIYVATFGDPKLYLPEGRGIMPAACRGENLSDYRAYVPDCQAYKGLLGAYIPYEPEGYTGKMGTWCNKMDMMCSSHLNPFDHTNYVSEGLYEDASKLIFDKICKAFGKKNKVSSPHDTAILIDSTGSMEDLIKDYKQQAQRLAEQTLAEGGRIALYDYKDYASRYQSRQLCSFETCTLEKFKEELKKLTVYGGGDDDESLLASSMHLMEELNWKRGSVKSVIVLTDAGYHDPDLDIRGTTKLDVIRLSKQIDPVNFYIITIPEMVEVYEDLATATGGRVVTTVDDLGELTDYIMARYDALPRVEEVDEAKPQPVLTVESIEIEGEEATVKFRNTGTRAMVILNDVMLGTVEGNSVTVTELDFAAAENTLMLVPLEEDIRGEGVEIALGGTGEDESDTDEEGETRKVDEADGAGGARGDNEASEADGKGSGESAGSASNESASAGGLTILSEATFFVPKAPNTGKR